MQVKKLKNKTSRYSLINVICKYITGKKPRIKASDIVNHPEFNKNYHIPGVLIRLQSYPHICYYIDKYLNHLYRFDSYDPELFIESLRLILIQNNITKKDLYYPRYVDNQLKLVKLFREYLDLVRINYNDSDIQSLLFLYNNGIIGEVHVDHLKQTLGYKVSKAKESNDFPSISSESVVSSNQIKNSDEIKQLCQNIKEYIKNREICKKCSLYNNRPVILETNVKSIEKVDVAFIAANPGREEREQDRPLIGKSGQLFRKHILDKLLYQFPNLKYLLTNCILCSTNNTSEIKGVKKVIQNCHSNLINILGLFKPDLIVLIGEHPCRSLNINIKGGITRHNSKIIDNRIVISVHPSYVLRNPNNIKYLDKVYETLHNLISNQISSNKVEEEKTKIEKSDQITEDCILIDIKHFDETVIYIFYDTKEQKKKYRTVEVNFPVYIKSGGYGDCDIIEDSVDFVCYLTNKQRDQLLRILNKKLIETVELFPSY